MSIEKLKKNYPVTIRWIHFPLHPETPQEGRALAGLFAGRDLTPMRERMKALMKEAGLEYGDRTHTFNSRLAQELGKWADEQASGEKIHDALYGAYFVGNRNIGDIDVLKDVAVSVGLDGNEARRILENRDYKAAVDEDWQRSREYGVTAVPTFYAKDLVVVGCQPYETLEQFVQHLLELDSKQKEAE